MTEKLRRQFIVARWLVKTVHVQDDKGLSAAVRMAHSSALGGFYGMFFAVDDGIALSGVG